MSPTRNPRLPPLGQLGYKIKSFTRICMFWREVRTHAAKRKRLVSDQAASFLPSTVLPRQWCVMLKRGLSVNSDKGICNESIHPRCSRESLRCRQAMREHSLQIPSRTFVNKHGLRQDHQDPDDHVGTGAGGLGHGRLVLASHASAYAILC
jgi:hypothetical protein